MKANRLLLAIVLLQIFAASGFAQSWVSTNTRSLKSVPAPDSDPPARFFVRTHERMAMEVQASATIGGRIVANYHVHAIDATLNTNTMTEKEVYLASTTNKIELIAKYYRGRIYEVDSAKTAATISASWVSIFSSGDQHRLVTVRDNGPIWTSEDSGAHWRRITAPGHYEFVIDSTPKGSQLLAVASIISSPELESATNFPGESWYSFVSAADGSKLVAVGGPSNSAPALSISNSGSNIVVSWPASFTGYLLQQSEDPVAANWFNVTEAVNVVGGENQVIVKSPAGDFFFRLKRP